MKIYWQKTTNLIKVNILFKRMSCFENINYHLFTQILSCSFCHLCLYGVTCCWVWDVNPHCDVQLTFTNWVLDIVGSKPYPKAILIVSYIILSYHTLIQMCGQFFCVKVLKTCVFPGLGDTKPVIYTHFRETFFESLIMILFIL